MRRFAWWGLVCGMVGLLGCAEEEADDGERDAQVGDASLDAGPDARSGDSSIDANIDAHMDAHTDAQPDAQPDAWSGSCDVSAFISAHQSCGSDEECVIVGACSGGFGFEAVNAAAKDEAQRLSDQTPRQCAAYDGPLYHAVCEQGRCRKRATGHACGEAPDPDGGTHPGRCAPDQEIYNTVGNDAGPGMSSCFRRCSGPSDTRCGAGLTCRETEVCSASAGPTSSCGPFTLGLCRP